MQDQDLFLLGKAFSVFGFRALSVNPRTETSVKDLSQSGGCLDSFVDETGHTLRGCIGSNLLSNCYQF